MKINFTSCICFFIPLYGQKYKNKYINYHQNGWQYKENQNGWILLDCHWNAYQKTIAEKINLAQTVSFDIKKNSFKQKCQKKNETDGENRFFHEKCKESIICKLFFSFYRFVIIFGVCAILT